MVNVVLDTGINRNSHHQPIWSLDDSPCTLLDVPYFYLHRPFIYITLSAFLGGEGDMEIILFSRCAGAQGNL